MCRICILSAYASYLVLHSTERNTAMARFSISKISPAAFGLTLHKHQCADIRCRVFVERLTYVQTMVGFLDPGQS